MTDLDQTREQLELIRVAAAECATKLDEANALSGLMLTLRTMALAIGETTITTEVGAALILREMAERLSNWAIAPGVGTTVSVACLLMAADHVELGSPVSVGEIVATNLRDFTAQVIQG